MNLAKIHQVLFEPSLITPAAHTSIVKLLADHATMSASEFAQREGTGSCGEKVDVPQAELVDGIGYIPVVGPLGMDLGSFEKGAGCTDYDDIEDEMGVFEEDPECKAIVFCIDSPGGMVSGCFELCAKIQALEKPCYAFTRGQMCSAAYAIGASCDGSYYTRSADIGSIGVYIPFQDVTAALEKAGVKMEVFASGKYKGMGHPGIPLSDAQRELITNRVNQINGMFQAHVLECRGEVAPEDMEGQSFFGAEAGQKNLADSMVSDLDEAVEDIRKRNGF